MTDMLFSSFEYQPPTNVTTNQMTSNIAVMTRFLRHYSSCFAVSFIFILLF